MKTCSKCGETKPVDSFRQRPDRGTPNAACKACDSRAAMDYAKAHPEGKRSADKRYASAHAEERAASLAAWVAGNKERNRQNARIRTARWRAENPERDAANRAKWRAANIDVERGYSHTRRARAGGSNSVYQTIPVIGETCSYCPALATEVDHVWPLRLGGSNDASNLVPACRQCNRSKGAKPLAEWLGFTEPE